MGIARSWTTLEEYFKAGKLRSTWQEAFEELEALLRDPLKELSGS